VRSPGNGGLSTLERAERLAAQTKLAAMLATEEARAKVLANPALLPTVRVAGKAICARENLGLPCPMMDPNHFLRYSHRVCAYCYVGGHTLPTCPLAEQDGVPISTWSSARARGGGSADALGPARS